MNSIQRASRLILAINLFAQTAGVSHAALGNASLPLSNPIPHRGHVNTLDAGTQGSAKAAYPQLPLYFEANRGQADPSVKFVARGPGYRLSFSSTEATLVLLPGRKALSDTRHRIRIHLKGGNRHPVVEGQGLLPGISNYFIGNDSKKWLTNVAHYSKVAYKQVYPGIDMIYEGDGPQLEYSFIVAPGANPDLIRMNFKGADRLRLNHEGSLLISFKDGAEVAFKAPYLYQLAGNERVSVQGHFVIEGKRLVRFEVGDYIRSKELVIDPSLAYSTYLGGTVADRAFAIDVDATGNAYVTGETASGGFPGTAGQYQAANAGGAFDVFVTKINPAGTAVVWSTYVGGGGIDIGLGIAVDGSGNVYITGSTTNAGAVFPITLGPVNAGGTDAFVTAINPAGTALVYSTLLGGAGEDAGNGIAVNAAGVSYIAGHTTSNAVTFPESVGSFQDTNGGGADDGFVASLSVAGTHNYVSFLGGTGADKGNAIAVDSLGNAYVTGQAADAFPITPLAVPTAFKTTITGAFDAFVVKVDPTGATRLYSTYVGGSDIDEGTAIALDSSNNAYITGFTSSADFPDIGFATVGQTTIGTAPDAFVFKLHIGNGGAHLDGVYSTYLGASTDDRGMSIAVDAAGDAYVSGHTTSGDFPTVNPLPGQTVLGATGKAFVTELGPTGAIKVFSTYLGGVTDQAAQGIALDSSNNIYVAGWTDSTDFDTAIPIQAANAGSFDAFVTKIGAPTPAAGGTNITTGFSISPAAGTATGGTQVIITGTGLTGATSVTFAGVNALSFTVNSNTQITAISPAHAAGPAVDVVVTRTSGSAVAGNYTYTSVVPSASGAGSFIFPSPAEGPTADIVYIMAEAGTAHIRVYNEIGDLVIKVDEPKPVGQQSSRITTARLAPGVYFYILNLNYDSGNTEKRKLKKFVVKH